MLLSGLSADRNGGERSLRVASRLYSLSRWVAISQEKMYGTKASVQDFVRYPLFTRRYFFSEAGISMLNTAVEVANAVRHSSEFDPWGTIEAGPVIVDLKSCRKKVVLRRKAAKYSRE